jgi:Ras-related protein Rab-23
LKVCFDRSNPLVAIKILVVGNGGVGKSSLIRKFCKDQYTDQYKKTIGVDFLEKQQYIPSIGQNATLMLWDTAGFQ